MSIIGTPFTSSAVKAMLLGSGELGKEVVIELKRLGVEVIACDSYPNAPAMQVADRAHVFSMLDGAELERIIRMENPHYIIPEVEAIATETLAKLETEGFTVVPTAKAARLTMNRRGIRQLAAEELKLPTSPYRFASTFDDFKAAVKEIGIPCVVKPIMSSSGKGQSVIKTEADIEKSWEYSQKGGRTGAGEVIIEGFIDFDYEITLLTVRHADGTSFCEPIGHIQVNGDYHLSWQPHQMSSVAYEKSKEIAEKITSKLEGFGIFGVELFIKGDTVYFSEVSPRPHDTGMVTMISQDLSEFALHVRAILGLPVPNIAFHGPSASAVIIAEGESDNISYINLAGALSEPDTALRLFGKPSVKGKRRMGVALARAATVEEAIEKAKRVSSTVMISL